MSASPSGPSNSGTPTANGAPTKFMRKPKPADPLRKSSSRPQRPPPLSKSSAIKPNGLKPIGRPGHAPQSSTPSRTVGFSSNGPNSASLPKAQSGFTEVPQGKYEDYPLYTTKKALKDGLRYHVARFAARKKDIDPSDQNEFTRPVSLHRRDPRLPPPGKAVKGEDPATGLPLDDKDQEKLEIARLEREAQRAADLAQIAPTGNNASALAARKNAAFRNEKTTQIYRNDSNEAQKKESDLKYEEAIPWVLEDAENKHTWVGTYEAALSSANVILVIDGNSFKMVPIEKWYKFTPKNQFKTMTIEEAEAQMSKKSKVSRWAMHTQEQQQQDQEKKDTQRLVAGLYKVKGESSTFKRSGKTETQDADDIDFEGDLFEDDDEQPTVEPDRDEETKHAADKIKREQLGANLFGEGDENEVEKELQEEEKEEEAKKKLGKSMKKALKKREKNYLYDSESSHPYSTSVWISTTSKISMLTVIRATMILPMKRKSKKKNARRKRKQSLKPSQLQRFPQAPHRKGQIPL
jgi:transcription initiation factor TFIIF subunit alpha